MFGVVDAPIERIKQIQGELERLLPQPLPEALFTLLGCLAQDKSRQGRLGDFRWLRVDEIGPTWQQLSQLEDEEEASATIAGEWDERVRRIAFHERRVPIAEFNGDVWLFLDYAPTNAGTEGQVIQVDPEAFNWFWLAPSLDQLVVDLAGGRLLDPDLGTEE